MGILIVISELHDLHVLLNKINVLITGLNFRVVDLTVHRTVYDDGLLVLTSGVSSTSPGNNSTVWHSCAGILCLGCKLFKMKIIRELHNIIMSFHG